MTWRVLVDAAHAIRSGIADPVTAALPIAAIGWATVERERAQGELDALLAADPNAPRLAPWRGLERDAALGAGAWVRAASEGQGDPALVVLEPDTEGLLAAFLARFGEGVGAVYFGDGALPAGRVVRSRPRWGPHVVVLGRDER
jgi:hypothetical protein